MAGARRNLSIIVPAYREAPNLTVLCERVLAACRAADIDAEIIIVDDDSRDGTEQIVADLAGEHPVRVLVRRGQRDLSTAVLAGFELARFDCLLVMDGDLQHPPEQVPDVAGPVLEGAADICVGSRYVRDASTPADWSAARDLNSRMATLLARPLTPVRDPMAGFFCLRRGVLAGCPSINPVGYKILLEILARSRGARVVEVPIHFGPRYAGSSKLDARQQLRYLRHVLRLYRYRYPWLTLAAAMIVVAIVLAIAAFRH